MTRRTDDLKCIYILAQPHNCILNFIKLLKNKWLIHLSGVNILISINHLGGNQLAIKVIFKYD